MQGELSQIISLTSYGNGFFNNEHLIENYFPNNTTFQFCNSVDFRDFKKRSFSSKFDETIFAKNPLEWFRNLKKQGCQKLRLYYEGSTNAASDPEYNTVGFVGGGGTWLIESIFDNHSSYWHKRWQVTNQNADDRKIWSVDYGRTLEKFPITNQQLDIVSITSQLKDILIQLVEFCHQQNLKGWAETFGKALHIFSSQEPNKDYYHYDLIALKNYPVSSQQLLFAVGKSWVFGGMGWWNDMSFENEAINESYLKLSQQLYETLVKGIVAVTNSF